VEGWQLSKRSVNGTYRPAARFVSLICQEVRHGREAGKHEATKCQGVADPGVEAGGERRGPRTVLSPPGDLPTDPAVVAVRLKGSTRGLARPSRPAAATAEPIRLQFTELRAPEEASPAVAADGFELRWPDGLTLAIPAQFDEVALRRLLLVLEVAGVDAARVDASAGLP
jgi:hypothetical protein